MTVAVLPSNISGVVRGNMRIRTEFQVGGLFGVLGTLYDMMDL